MKNSTFNREIKLLIYYICQYGLEHTKQTYVDFNVYKIEHRKEFFKQVHKGFAIGQENITRLLTEIINEQKQIKVELKSLRSKAINKSGKSIDAIEKEQRQLIFQEKVIRKFADSLAWLIYKHDLSTIRRFYLGNPPIDITNSNIESCIETANDLMKRNPSDFALINDLTTFIQISDITHLNSTDHCIKLLEIKEGEVNHQIVTILNNYMENECDYYLYNAIKDKGKHFDQQFNRVINQMKTNDNVLNTLTTGKGVDGLTGQNVRIVQETLVLDDFFDVVVNLLKKSSAKGYAISVVEECVLIGVYDVTKFNENAFEAWVGGLGIKSPIYDLKSSFLDPLACPIYALPFSSNDLFDLTIGKKVIKITIDMNIWLKTFEKVGYSYRWMSKKETARMNSKYSRYLKMIDIDGKGIELKYNNTISYLYGGSLGRIFTMFTKPSAVLKLLQSIDEHSEDMEDE
ncbi:hypothetical protein [Sinanaerobacter chloroacetimidivorans]|uniref:Uncharacterized protein n=1 Tax=Sinanaerobacter chloroacetimidivorans TaxID=2818044 RepID=A0A8J8B2F3_9FIRM|nr:hypothetical protein [Sinanaerobacter chloroacetimidivorans]MBR0599244.1 hypothetical protein [Sinanaerobacter chloroacetimidivorans]